MVTFETQLSVYEELLLKFNKKLNLLSKESIKNINENHFQDCLELCKLLKSLGIVNDLYDFGSGNGLPGFVYALYNPLSNVILVEKDQRKSQFLKHASSTVGADNISIWSKLAEDITPSTLTGICRAFLPMAKALPIWNKICLSGSVIYMMKSVDWENELSGVDYKGWKFDMVHKYSLMNNEVPRLIIKAARA